MKQIPALSLRDGHVVVVEGGKYTPLRNKEGQYRSPVNILKEHNFQEEEIFILDLDGIERNSPNLNIVKRIAALKDVWLDAGTDDADSMMDLFISDASRVVMSTAYVDSLSELTDALDLSENIIVSIGYDQGIVSPNKQICEMNLDTLLDEISTMPNIRTGMLFDLGGLRDGTAPDPGVVSRMADTFKELYVSGFVGKTVIDSLESSGIAGVIVDFRTMEAMQDV
ncbi:MAG: HisA/HisF-related TIM barrel protein [Thermoplasmata archaeon]|nr:HisA/HisF-related TIM barrel protein [Thermoplasmata archaeon]